MISLSTEIERLNTELANSKKLIQSITENEQNEIWDKIEISISERPIHQAIIDSKRAAELLATAIHEIKSTLQSTKGSLTITQQGEKSREELESKLFLIAEENQKKDMLYTQQLDYLANLVNKMEEHYSKALPEHLKKISLTSDMSWASPTLLCLKLKSEHEKIEQEYATLRSQLSEESNSYLSANNQLKEQVRTFTHSLSEMTAKYNKEKEEKERMMHVLHGKEKGVFDAIRFKSVLEDNENLKRQVEELKYQLITEKKLKINQLFEDQDCIGRISILNQELNTLGNIKIELMDQIQQLRIAHSLQMAEKGSQIYYLEQENKLIYEKMVVSVNKE